MKININNIILVSCILDIQAHVLMVTVQMNDELKFILGTVG